MKKTAAFLTAVFASLAMTAAASAQAVVEDVVDGAENIVDDAGDAVEDIIDPNAPEALADDEGIVTDDVPAEQGEIAQLDDVAPDAGNNPGTGVDLIASGAVAAVAAGVAYAAKKRSLSRK